MGFENIKNKKMIKLESFNDEWGNSDIETNDINTKKGNIQNDTNITNITSGSKSNEILDSTPIPFNQNKQNNQNKEKNKENTTKEEKTENIEKNEKKQDEKKQDEKKGNILNTIQKNINQKEYIFETLDIDKLTPFNTWKNHEYDQYDYDDEKFEELKESIETMGRVIEPLILWERQKENSNEIEYLVLSGNHRLKALKELKEKDIKYTKVATLRRDDFTETDAEFIFNATNLTRREFSRMNVYQRAKAIYQLVRSTEQKIKETNKNKPKDEQIQTNVVKEVGEQYKQGKSQTYKYLKLYKSYNKDQFELIGEKKAIDINTAYELAMCITKKSLLTELMELIKDEAFAMNLQKAMEIKEYMKLDGEKTIDDIVTICTKEKEITSYSLKTKDFIEYDKYFKGKTNKEISSIIKEALAVYFKK